MLKMTHTVYILTHAVCAQGQPMFCRS